MNMKSLYSGAVLILLSLLSLQAFAANVPPLRAKIDFATHPHWDYYLTSSHPSGRLQSVEQYHLQPAIDLLAQQKFEYAYDELVFILAWFPNHPKALNLLTQLTTRVNQPQVAERHFRDAFGLYPDRAQTHMLYGNFLSKSGQRDKAIESYKRAIELDPNYAEAHYNLGLAYYHQKKYDLANQHAQIAYSYGYPLPGLERLLKGKKAWNTAQRPSAEDRKSAASEQAAKPAGDAEKNKGDQASKTGEDAAKNKGEQASKSAGEPARAN